MALVVEMDDRKIEAHLRAAGLLHNLTEGVPDVGNPIYILQQRGNYFIRFARDFGPDGQYVWIALREPTAQDFAILSITLARLLAGCSGIEDREVTTRGKTSYVT